MKVLLKKARTIYHYITQKKSQAITYMSLEPKQPKVETAIKGIGFTLIKEGKKDCIVDLQWKTTNLRHELILAHYSMPLFSVFLHECCMALSFSSLSRKGPVAYDEIFVHTKKLYDIFKMEHLYSYDYDEDKVKDGVKFFFENGLFNKNDEEKTFSIVDSEEARSMLTFYIELIGPFIDTYKILLLTIEYMRGKPMVMPTRKLVKELHASI